LSASAAEKVNHDPTSADISGSMIFLNDRAPSRIKPGAGLFRITIEGSLSAKLLQHAAHHLDVERLGCDIFFDIKPKQCGVVNRFILPDRSVAMTREKDLGRATKRPQAAQEIANGLATKRQVECDAIEIRRPHLLCGLRQIGGAGRNTASSVGGATNDHTMKIVAIDDQYTRCRRSALLKGRRQTVPLP
jgi:hypothetical protein